MAAAVRAAGCLPALCRVPAGESRDTEWGPWAERGLRAGRGPGARPGEEERGAARGPWAPHAGPPPRCAV